MRVNEILKTAIALLLASAIQNGPAFSAAPAIVTKNAGESDAAFVQRITKHDITSSSMVDGKPQLGSTTALIKGSEALVAFTEEPESGDPSANDINMDVFLKQSGLSYARIGNAQVCEDEGGSPTLRTFFYASLNGVPDPVVGVICGWDATHAAADCQADDEVRFFKADGTAIPMEKFAKLFYKQAKPDKNSTYTCQVDKFKTATDVKNLLKANH
jgi:hypothetical protein